MKRVRQFLNKIEISWKKVMAILCVFCVIVIIFGVLTFKKIDELAYSTFKSVNESTVTQAANVTDMVSRQINEVCKQFAQSEEFVEYSGFPNGGYYETLKYVSEGENTRDLYRYVRIKKRLKQKIADINITNDLFLSTYFYDSEKKVVFLNNGNQYAVGDFSDMNVITYIGNDVKPRISAVSRIIADSKKEVLSVIYEIDDKSSVIINIEADKLLQSMVGTMDWKSNTIVVTGENNKCVLLGKGNLKKIEKIFKVVYDADNINENAEYTVIKNAKEYIYSKYSPVLDWNIILAVNESVLNGFYGKNRIIFLFFLILLIVLPVMLIYFLMAWLYSPMTKIAEKFSEKQDGKRSVSVGFIENQIDETLLQNNSLRERLRESMPAYRDKFITMLLAGKVFSKQEISERLEFCGIDLLRRYFCVLIIGADLKQLSGIDIDEQNLMLLKLSEIIANELKSFSGIFVQDDKFSFAVILNNDEDVFANSAYDFAMKVKNSVYEIHHLNVNAGIGKSVDGLENIRFSYSLAREVYDYTMKKSVNDIANIDDTNYGSNTETKYPSDIISGMERAIKFADEDELNKETDKLKKYAKENSIPLDILKRWCISVIGNVLLLGSEAGVSGEILLAAEKEYISENEKREDAEGVCECLREVLNLVNNELQNMATLRKNVHIDRIKEIINSKNGNINVSELSSMLNLSPSYISRLFKKFESKNISEYLFEVKMECAIKYITETNMKAYEIGELVGYSSSFYFIKSFKKYTGMTPIDYRNKFKKQS